MFKCGTGILSLLLAELGHTVTGIDLAPEMIERAQTIACQTDWSVEFRRGDAEALAASDNSFELVTARHLIWTLPRPASALREWQRVIEPGSRILLIEEGYWNDSEPWDEHEDVSTDLPMYGGRPLEEMCEFLEKEGFDEVEYEPLMDPVLWVIRLVTNITSSLGEFPVEASVGDDRGG